MKMTTTYNDNKLKKKGDKCVCPSCGKSFVKESYQQVFCKTKKGTKCKDKYWNTVTETKRNNTTRISPASRSWSCLNYDRNNLFFVGGRRPFNPDDYEHPFSSTALGQD